jgi:hypothetical protein
MIGAVGFFISGIACYVGGIELLQELDE